MWHFYTPENVRKPRFQGVKKCDIGLKWVNSHFVSSFQKQKYSGLKLFWSIFKASKNVMAT